MKTTKKEMRMFSFFDYDGMAKHFEDMAAKGWMLDKVTRNNFVYRKADPQKVKFAVTYYADASDFDRHITDGQMDLNEFCRVAGWQFIGSIAQMHIYCNFNENPLPLETDPVVQVANVHNAMKKNFLPSSILLVILSLSIIGIYVSQLITNPTYQLVDNSPFYIVVIYLTIIALVGRELVVYIIWKKKAAARAAEGYPVPSGKSSVKFQIGALVWVIAIAAAYIMSMLTQFRPVFIITTYGIMLVTFVIALGGRELFKKLNFSRNANRIASVLLAFAWTFIATGGIAALVVKNHINIKKERPRPVETYEYLGYSWEIYKQDIPLKVEHFVPDVTDTEIYSYEADVKEGAFATKTEARQQARRDLQLDVPEIRYEIYKTDFKWAYNLLFEDLYKDMEYYTKDIPEEFNTVLKEEDPGQWGAVKAYRQYEAGLYPTGNYLLCFENSIVELHYYDDLTPQQKKLIGDRLQFEFIGF